ncbi:DJ-1/PfpI family protein [Pseudofrankia asymbiotica]|uniref:DJ-1/PfpI family protein n=1 Tax=Pseudofrankia asymbiotica TaxID=1834516 RepID=UPI0009757089|nr:DJ-1/PfpI family protein [Pseudofrankia asymbiotica]
MVVQVAVLTFDGFNELDSFIAAAIINRCRRDGLTAYITTPTPVVTSMNGVEVTGQRPLAFAAEADVVLVGSGIRTRDVIQDDDLLGSFSLDPTRQLIGSQCSGALVLARLGLLESVQACTDATSRPWVEACGVEVVDAPFRAVGNIATAGGCLASQYLAAWVIGRTLGEEPARAAIDYVAPVGEKRETVDRVFAVLRAGDQRPAARI